eukprot:1238534-Rhodomonas_salina.6
MWSRLEGDDRGGWGSYRTRTRRSTTRPRCCWPRTSSGTRLRYHASAAQRMRVSQLCCGSELQSASAGRTSCPRS